MSVRYDDRDLAMFLVLRGLVTKADVKWVNGDGTVTLFLPRTGLSSAPLAGEGATLVTRRVEPGRAVVIFSRTLGTALVIKVREVLPAGG